MKTLTLALCLMALALAGCAGPSSAELRDDSERAERVRAYRELVDSGVPEAEAANIVYGGVRDTTAAPASSALATIEAREDRRARADSLLARDPATLTDAETRWLALYYAEESRAETERAADRQERTSRAVNSYLGVSVALGAIGAIVGYFLLATSE